ncbi:MAG: hypothetical protein HZB20_05410, partial [Chloroflexi bacterium]|nr:hypothetical protein [Chloroflexota bacterium]
MKTKSSQATTTDTATLIRRSGGRLVKRFSLPGVQYAKIEMGRVTRLALMITPVGRGPVHIQLGEALRSLRRAFDQQSEKMTVTVQTVFLKDAR